LLLFFQQQKRSQQIWKIYKKHLISFLLTNRILPNHLNTQYLKKKRVPKHLVNYILKLWLLKMKDTFFMTAIIMKSMELKPLNTWKTFNLFIFKLPFPWQKWTMGTWFSMFKLREDFNFKSTAIQNKLFISSNCK